MVRTGVLLVLAGALLCGTGRVVLAADANPPLITIKRMSLEMALKLAQAAIAQCRKDGLQVAVTVIDRGGHPQVYAATIPPEFWEWL